MQIMTIFIDQFLSEKSEIDGKANTLAMVFVRYTMDHDCRAYGTPIIIHGISTHIIWFHHGTQVVEA